MPRARPTCAILCKLRHPSSGCRPAPCCTAVFSSTVPPHRACGIPCTDETDCGGSCVACRYNDRLGFNVCASSGKNHTCGISCSSRVQAEPGIVFIIYFTSHPPTLSRTNAHRSTRAHVHPRALLQQIKSSHGTRLPDPCFPKATANAGTKIAGSVPAMHAATVCLTFGRVGFFLRHGTHTSPSRAS